MAITEILVPQTYQPVYNPIVLVVSSDNIANCSFKFVADLYVNGILAIRLYTIPEGNNSYGVFRIEEILKDYLSFDLKTSTVGFETNPNSIISYNIEFREEYDTNTPCTGVTTVSAVLDTTSTFYAWNGALQYIEFANYLDSVYKTTNILAKFLSSVPDNTLIGTDEEFNLNFINVSGSEVRYIDVTTYDEAGNTLQTVRIANAHTSVSTPADSLLSVGVGPWNLNASTLVSGTQPVIDDSVFYYDIVLMSGSPAAACSETKRLKIDYTCSAFETKRLSWLNRLGGFDSYSFKLKSFRKIDIQRTEYVQLIPTLSGSTYGYSLGDRGRTLLGISANEKLTYNTNWLTEAEGLWLEELYTSPEVNLFSLNGTRYNVSGAGYNNGFADFAIDLGVILATGTAFTYSVDDGSPIGMANSGSGVITGFDAGSDLHQTTVVCTVNAGAIITGHLTAFVKGFLPVIVKSPSWEEKLKVNTRKIQYAIEIEPAYSVNVQR
jgi:hypothetical protein